jgi:hypothetical protein
VLIVAVVVAPAAVHSVAVIEFGVEAIATVKVVIDLGTKNRMGSEAGMEPEIAHQRLSSSMFHDPM